MMRFLLSILMLSASSASAIAQNMDAADDPDWHFRFELFQMLLEQNGLQTSSEINAIINAPGRSVIVLLVNLHGIAAPRILERLCEEGGTVLLACDSNYSGGRLAEFQPGPVKTLRTEDRYQDHDDCIEITNLDSKHPLMEGVNRLVVNRSGWLAKPRWFLPTWDVIARLPRNCSPGGASTEPLIVEVKISETATGRMFLTSDQSLFTNGMLWHGDNSIFAINMSQLLCTDNKSKLLFVADGSTLQSYQQSPALDPNAQSSPNLPLPEQMPRPEGGFESMLRFANAVLKNVETSNVANEFLANRPRNVAPPYYKRYVMFALAMLALLIVLWRLLSAGNPFRAAMPHREMKTAHDLTADRKIEANEFGMAASMLARDLCREVTGSDDSAAWLEKLHGNPATGEASVVAKPLRKRMEVVLDLAINTRTVHITRQRFEFIGQTIQELRQLHQQNQLMA